MPILNLAIGKSKYNINCQEGEQDKIMDLSKKLNERVNKLALSLRNADEKTILMLCALTMEDELEQHQDPNSSNGNEEISNQIHNLITRINSL